MIAQINNELLGITAGHVPALYTMMSHELLNIPAGHPPAKYIS